jgi:hypothetical protein
LPQLTPHVADSDVGVRRVSTADLSTSHPREDQPLQQG